jgi:hypothetical protein
MGRRTGLVGRKAGMDFQFGIEHDVDDDDLDDATWFAIAPMLVDEPVLPSDAVRPETPEPRR